jgi:hypothetical protein
MAQNLFGDLALQLADGADLVPAVVAFDLGVIVGLLVEIEAISPALAALELNAHSNGTTKRRPICSAGAGALAASRSPDAATVESSRIVRETRPPVVRRGIARKRPL